MSVRCTVSEMFRMPFLLPPMTHMGTSGNWTQAHWAQVHRLNHGATPAPFIITMTHYGKIMSTTCQ